MSWCNRLDVGEFLEQIKDYPVDEQVAEILIAKSNLTAVVSALDDELKEKLPIIENMTDVNPVIDIKTRTSHTVDNLMLKVSFPEIYDKMAQAGVLKASMTDLRKYAPDDVVRTVTTDKTSKWLALRS